MKDINKLDYELISIINNLKHTNVSTNSAYNAPIDKQNLENLKLEIANALTDFKNAIIKYLSE
ncbi:hypothetical protein OXPF_39690 [Oxobacter pfennigii]|uniref:Uncharacterized protein n=1 Tax=Oxobacter pfennigii TaxID=36849 RepID=A0A0P9AAX9_9CLOT|nr:hypothetical protein [Oxobacter pfennigii]KPU42190.1 hypothetical protein OXPF_39690 [Oxobacter pfennigii]